MKPHDIYTSNRQVYVVMVFILDTYISILNGVYFKSSYQVTPRCHETMDTNALCVSEIVLSKVPAALDAPPHLFPHCLYGVSWVAHTNIYRWEAKGLEVTCYQRTNFRARQSRFPVGALPIQLTQGGCCHLADA